MYSRSDDEFAQLQAMEPHPYIHRQVEDAKLLDLCDKIAMLRRRDIRHAVPLIKEWEEQGNPVDLSIVRMIMRKLRQWKRPLHAMEIADWMYFRKPFKLELQDTIFRMEIAARANLTKRARHIFKKLPAEQKTADAYNVMFLLFSQKKMLLHAEDFYYKFKQAKLKPTDYTFAILACLYRRCGLYSKVIRLQEDIHAAGLKPCRCYLNNLLTAKFHEEGVEAAEEIFNKVTAQEPKHKHMATYSMMAAAYISCGTEKKALNLLEHIEQSVESNIYVELRRTYHVLISMYATLKRIDAMERVWGRIHTHRACDYVAMIEACGRAGDIERAEAYFKQADTSGFGDQGSVYAALLCVYAAGCMTDKADSLYKKMKVRDVSRDARCYHYMVLCHLNAKDMDRAISYLEASLIAGLRDGHAKPYLGTLADVLKALGETGDVKQAEYLLALWRKRKQRTNISLYNHLLRVYIKAGLQVKGDFLHRLAGEYQRPNIETHKLLEQIKLECKPGEDMEAYNNLRQMELLES